MGCCKSYFQESDSYHIDAGIVNYLRDFSALPQLNKHRNSLESTQEQEHKSKEAFEITHNKANSPISYIHTMELPINSNEISIDSWKHIQNQSITEINQ